MMRVAPSAFFGGDPVAARSRAAANRRAHEILARYDNATTTHDNIRNWAGSDWMSAKSANSYQVRRQLRIRSRYELGNNPYLWGIANGNADDFVGSGGPTLQVKTPNASYNRAVERCWNDWCAEVDLAEKIRTMKLARTVDGEGFLILKTVEDLEHPVKLYPVDVEADQVTTPAPRDLGELWVDGLTLHPVTGRPTHYHVMKHHPGDYFFPDFNPIAVEKLPARFVIHWFPKFRPGQVRGVPVFTPSLDLFNELRSFRRATLGAAEMAADYAAVLEQHPETGAYGIDDGASDQLEAWKRVPLHRKMLTALPPGAKLSQLRSEHPATTYEMFCTLCLGEAVRPLSYPLNLALGTSQRFNFSSAKLDHINYRNSITVERDQCDTVALHRLFRAWYEEASNPEVGAIAMYDGLRVPPVEWHWPGFESIDPMVDAQTANLQLSGGTLTRREFWARRGQDWREMLAQLKAEAKEIERLGLTFGEPVKRNLTETTTVDDREAANAA